MQNARRTRSLRCRRDIAATSPLCLASRARVPAVPALPALPTPPSVPDVPAAPTNGNGEGGSGSPNEHGNGPDPAALSRDDLAVFEVLWRRREKMLAADKWTAERLREAHVAGRVLPSDVVAFIDRMTPSFLDDVTKARRTLRMAANGRKSGGT